MNRLFCIVFSVLFLPLAAAQAHGDGFTIEESVEGYVVDIGFSEEVLRTDVQTRIDFLLYEMEKGAEVGYDSVWVRLEKEGRVLLAGEYHNPKYGDAGLTYRFFESGTHELYVRYQDASGEIVSGEFPVRIEAGEKGNVSGDGHFSGRALLFVALLSFAASAVFFGVAQQLVKVVRLLSGKTSSISFEKLKSVQLSSTLVAVYTKKHDFLKKCWVIFVNLLLTLLVAAVTYYVMTLVVGDRQRLSVVDGIENLWQSVSALFSDDDYISVVLHETGYEPREITLSVGDTIRFSTTVDRPHWPASNLHPSHEIYPEFDPKEPVPPEYTWDFTFDEVGEWKFHDHIRSYYTGVVYVVE